MKRGAFDTTVKLRVKVLNKSRELQEEQKKKKIAFKKIQNQENIVWFYRIKGNVHTRFVFQDLTVTGEYY